jgi:hypothetical protein
LRLFPQYRRFLQYCRAVTAEEFATSVDRLLNQVRHWETNRWAVRHAAGSAQSRSDLLYALVQRLADLGADAEGRRRRRVPRLSDLSLPDQLRVVADDLLAANAPEELLTVATEDVTGLRRIF